MVVLFPFLERERLAGFDGFTDGADLVSAYRTGAFG